MSPFYRFIRGLLKIWLWLSGTEYIGLENIPQNEPLMVISNHSSLGDPAMVGCAFPFQIVFLAKSELGKNSLLGYLFAKLGVVFLKRGEADLASLRKAIKVLSEEKTVGIFPEGHRTPGVILGDFKQGAAFIAYKAGVRILPMATINSKDILRFWKRNKKVIIGRPIKIEKEALNTNEVLEKYTAIMHGEVKNLILDYTGSNTEEKILPPCR